MPKLDDLKQFIKIILKFIWLHGVLVVASGIFSCCGENLSFHHANSEFQLVRSSSLTRDWGAQSLNCLGHLGSPWNNLLWEKFILSPFWSLSLKSRCRQGYAPLKSSRKESSRFFPAFDRWWQSLIFRGLRLHPCNLCPCHFMAFFLYVYVQVSSHSFLTVKVKSLSCDDCLRPRGL